ncbi:ComF family protein [Bifidobacterium merycicum]
MRTRGRRHLWPLAKAAAAELAAAGVEACAVNALRTRHIQGKAVETHSALGRAARLDGQLEVNDPGLIAGKKVLILDDIVTTGTTMRRCAEAIRGARGERGGRIGARRRPTAC